MPCRMISYADNGIRYRADPRHAEALITKLGLVDANVAPTPSVKKPCRCDSACGEEEEEAKQRATRALPERRGEHCQLKS